MRDVTIKAVLNGFIVKVGCQTLVFNTIEDVAAALIEYQMNPAGVEERFLREAVNQDAGDQGRPETATEAIIGVHRGTGGALR